MEQTFSKSKDLTKRKYFDILDGSMASVLFIILQFLLTLVIAFTGGIQNKFMYDFWSMMLQLCFVGAVIIVSKARRVDWIEACNFKKKVDGKIVLYAGLFTLICMVLFTDLTSAFVELLKKIGYTSPLESGAFAQYNQITNVGEYLVSIITVCIIPPLCEETLFRGAVLNSFRGLNKWLGIFISGFCFMLMHGNPDQTIHQFILGIVLGYIAWETRNIWVCVLIHAINNFIAITITFAYSIISSGAGSQVIEGATEVAEYSWSDIAFTAIIGVFSAALGIFLVIKLTKKLKAHIQKKQEKSFQSETGKQLEQATEMIVTQDGQSTVMNTEIIEPEYQAKPDKRKLVLTVLTYAAFVAYFLKEWIEYLIKGLGL